MPGAERAVVGGEWGWGGWLLVINSDAVSQVLPSASESALEGQRAIRIAWPLHSRLDYAEAPGDRSRGRSLD